MWTEFGSPLIALGLGAKELQEGGGALCVALAVTTSSEEAQVFFHPEASARTRDLATPASRKRPGDRHEGGEEEDVTEDEAIGVDYF